MSRNHNNHIEDDLDDTTDDHRMDTNELVDDQVEYKQFLNDESPYLEGNVTTNIQTRPDVAQAKTLTPMAKNENPKPSIF